VRDSSDASQYVSILFRNILVKQSKPMRQGRRLAGYRTKSRIARPQWSFFCFI